MLLEFDKSSVSKDNVVSSACMVNFSNLEEFTKPMFPNFFFKTDQFVAGQRRIREKKICYDVDH